MKKFLFLATIVVALLLMATPEASAKRTSYHVKSRTERMHEAFNQREKAAKKAADFVKEQVRRNKKTPAYKAQKSVQAARFVPKKTKSADRYKKYHRR